MPYAAAVASDQPRSHADVRRQVQDDDGHERQRDGDGNQHPDDHPVLAKPHADP